MESEQLKPCPWCGDQPITFPVGDGKRALMIQCENPSCAFNPSCSYYNHAHAIAAWNRRDS